MKTNISEKLLAVLDHVDNHLMIKECAKKHHIELSQLKYLISLYQKHGAQPFDKKGKSVYSKETKLKMIKRFLKGETGYSLALELGATDRKDCLENSKIAKSI